MKKLDDAIIRRLYIWKDPDPIPGNDYMINNTSDVEKFEEKVRDYCPLNLSNVLDNFDPDDSILYINYGEGSEAEVTWNEIGWIDVILERTPDSIGMYYTKGEPEYIVYWHCDEWEEDPESVVPAILHAIELYFTNLPVLIRAVGFEPKYI